MAQTEALNMRLGEPDGQTDKCTDCGGQLTVLHGTDHEKVDEIGGFREAYQCDRCQGIGRYKVRWKDEKQTYLGVCAEARL